jgi:hypothetical protein
MRILQRIASGLLTVLGALGTVILFIIVLIALPLFIAGVLVDYMMFRPAREQALLARLDRIEVALTQGRPIPSP